MVEIELLVSIFDNEIVIATLVLYQYVNFVEFRDLQNT